MCADALCAREHVSRKQVARVSGGSDPLRIAVVSLWGKQAKGSDRTGDARPRGRLWRKMPSCSPAARIQYLGERLPCLVESEAAKRLFVSSTRTSEMPTCTNGSPRPVRAGVTIKMINSAESESDGEPPRPFQIQSYDNLLRFPQIPYSSVDTPSGNRPITTPGVDAIVVPTIRGAEYLRPAVWFAAGTKCHLIVVYTDKPPGGLAELLAGLGPDQVTVLTLRSGIRDLMLDLGASLPQSLVSPIALDISRKRNLGLLIGRVCGWTRMLFLDDDIRKLNIAKLYSAAALLDHYPVVGFQVKKYPDASVVGHARRLAGRRQEPFVSGGSLLVNPQLLNGYFAPIYHEDWLCLINHLRTGEVAIGGSVGQLPYLPFTSPQRARLEEFGDILLSGLLWLAHARVKGGAAYKVHSMTEAEYWREATDPQFWKQILEQRATLLGDITVRLTGKEFDGPSPLPSLAAAKERLGELKPANFTSFTESWLTSLAIWRSRLSALSQVGSIDNARAIGKALSELGLAHVVATHEVFPLGGSAPEFRWMTGFASRWSKRSGFDSRHRFGIRSGS